MSAWITSRDLRGQFRYESKSDGEAVWTVAVPLDAELQKDLDHVWLRYLPAFGFSEPVTEYVVTGEATGEGSGTPIYGEQVTAAAREFIAKVQDAGYELVAYAPNWQDRHRTFGIRTPAGDVVGQTTIDTGNDVAEFFRQFVAPVFGVAGGFGFLGQQAAALTGLQPQTAASIIRAAVNVAAGGDIERSLIGTIAPAVVSEYGPTTIFSSPELGVIEPELLTATIDTPGVPSMEDFFTANDYAFPAWEVASIDDGFFFDFESVEPIPTFQADESFMGPMPLPDFPAIDEGFTWDAPVEAGAVDDLVTVGDIQVVTADVAANYIGTGGSVEVRDIARPTTAPGATVVEVIKDATAAMVAALGLVQAYRSLTSKPAPNPVAQARQGQNTIRANPDGTITTTAPDGSRRIARPPVGQPQMTTDGSMIVNNGDGTYTRIKSDGVSTVNRYGTAAAAASNYTLPLLLAGGAALALFATRKR